MAAQASREQRLAIADIVVDNRGVARDLDARSHGSGRLRDRAAARSELAQGRADARPPTVSQWPMRKLSDRPAYVLMTVSTRAPRSVPSARSRRSTSSPTSSRPATSRPRSRSSSSGSAPATKDTVLLGATGTGKSATTAWLIERLQRPDAGHAAQQDPGRPARQRAARDAAEQRGRVLRLLLRLLPARGVRPADRHLHREGLLDQRRGRAAAALGHQLAADPAGHDRGRVACRASTAWAPRRSTSTGCCSSKVGDTIERDALLRKLVGMQYTRNDLAFTRGTFRVRGDTIEVHPAATRSSRSGSRCSATRSSG